MLLPVRKPRSNPAKAEPNGKTTSPQRRRERRVQCHGRTPWWKGMGNPEECPQEWGHGSLKGYATVLRRSKLYYYADSRKTMFTATADLILPSTTTGSFPRPRWFDVRMWGRPLDTCMLDIHFREKFQDAMATLLSDQERAGLDILTHGDFHVDEDLAGRAWHHYPLQRWAGFAGQILRRPGRTERGGAGTALHLLPPCAADLRGRARRRQRVSEFDEALGHAPGRIDPGLQVRSGPARRGLRGLRLPSMGALRAARLRARHGHSGRRRSQELQPPTGARARPGAGTAQRARLPLRRADCDRAGDRWLALLVPAGRSGHLGKGGQGHLSSNHGEHAVRLLGGHAVPDEGAVRKSRALPGNGRKGRGGTAVRAPAESPGLPAHARRLPPLRAPCPS